MLYRINHKLVTNKPVAKQQPVPYQNHQKLSNIIGIRNHHPFAHLICQNEMFSHPFFFVPIDLPGETFRRGLSHGQICLVADRLREDRRGGLRMQSLPWSPTAAEPWRSWRIPKVQLNLSPTKKRWRNQLVTLSWSWKWGISVCLPTRNSFAGEEQLFGWIPHGWWKNWMVKKGPCVKMFETMWLYDLVPFSQVQSLFSLIQGHRSPMWSKVRSGVQCKDALLPNTSSFLPLRATALRGMRHVAWMRTWGTYL